MPKDNRGYSLVELIVVIAIILILSTAGVLGFSSVSGKPAEQCASELKGAILANRTVSLGKKDAKLVISMQPDGVHVTESYTLPSGAHSSDKVIAPNTVDLTFSTNDSVYTAVDATGIEIEFDRSTGSLKNQTTDIYFRASKAGKSYKVTVYQLTGKVIAVKE